MMTNNCTTTLLEFEPRFHTTVSRDYATFIVRYLNCTRLLWNQIETDQKARLLFILLDKDDHESLFRDSPLSLYEAEVNSKYTSPSFRVSG